MSMALKTLLSIFLAGYLASCSNESAQFRQVTNGSESPQENSMSQSMNTTKVVQTQEQQLNSNEITDQEVQHQTEVEGVVTETDALVELEQEHEAIENNEIETEEATTLEKDPLLATEPIDITGIFLYQLVCNFLNENDLNVTEVSSQLVGCKLEDVQGKKYQGTEFTYSASVTFRDGGTNPLAQSDIKTSPSTSPWNFTITLPYPVNTLSKLEANASSAEGTKTAILIICPEGFILVPANDEVGLGDFLNTDPQKLSGVPSFCVMRYEAHYLLNSAGVRDPNQGVYAPTVSDQLNTTNKSMPINYVTIDEAVQLCKSLNRGGRDEFDLINNAQWQSIARSIETTESNYVDSQYLPIGITTAHFLKKKDGSEDEVALTTGDYIQGVNFKSGIRCESYNQESDIKYKLYCERKLTLSNGEEIFDFSGNMGEWVKETLDVDKIIMNQLASFISSYSTDGNCFAGPGVFTGCFNTFREHEEVNRFDIVVKNILSNRSFGSAKSILTAKLTDKLGRSIQHGFGNYVFYVARNLGMKARIENGESIRIATSRSGHVPMTPTETAPNRDQIQNSGIYHSSMSYDASLGNEHTGFRCVFRPTLSR